MLLRLVIFCAGLDIYGGVPLPTQSHAQLPLLRV